MSGLRDGSRTGSASTARGARPTLRRAAIVAALAVVAVAEEAAAFSSGDASSGRMLAYIDPGTGSFVIQALVAAAAGVAVTLKLYWTRIKRLFGFSTRTEEDDDLSDGPA